MRVANAVPAAKHLAKAIVLQRPDDLASLYANSGDAAAYRRLPEALAPILRATVRRWLMRCGRGPDAAENIVQETLLAINLKRQTWDESPQLEPWLRAIAGHKLIDALTHRRVSVHVPIEDRGDFAELGVETLQEQAFKGADLLATRVRFSALMQSSIL